MDRGAPDEQIMPMARGASLNIAGAACTKAALLAITVVLSWGLGASAVGRYAQAYALLTVLVAIAGLPFGAGVTRFVAMHLVDRDEGALRGAVRLAVGGTFAFSVLFALPLYAFAGAVAQHVFHDAGLGTPLRLVAVSLPPAALGGVGRLIARVGRPGGASPRQRLMRAVFALERPSICRALAG